MANESTEAKAKVEGKFINEAGELSTSPVGATAYRVTRSDTAESRDFTVGEFPPEIQTALAWFGLANREQNARNSGGKDSTVAERFENAVSTLESLLNGTWAERQGGGGVSLATLAEAVARFSTKQGSPITAEALIAALDDKEKYPNGEAREKKLAQWRGSAQVQAEVKAILAERAAKKAEAAEAVVISDLLA